jgi:glutamine amidotransferase
MLVNSLITHPAAGANVPLRRPTEIRGIAWDGGYGIGAVEISSDGERLVGCRWGRTLHYVEPSGVHDCEICGFPHIHHDPRRNYRAIVIASEPIANEHWREIPDRSVFAVSPKMALQIDMLPPTEADEAILA